MNNDVMPPDFVFLNPRPKSLGKLRAWETLYGFQGFSFPEKGGFLAHYHGRPRPNKGMAYSAASEANNIMKRLAIGIVMCLKPTLHPLRNFEVQLRRFVDYLYGPHYFHWRYYSDCPRELMRFGFLLLRRLGIRFELAYWLSRVPTTLLEYENAYRYRVEDIFTASSAERLRANPRGELRRLEGVYLAREHCVGDQAVSDKFKMVFRVLRFLLLVPRFKRAFVFALDGVEFSNLQLDDTESYWANRHNEYDFGGQPYGIRQLKQGFKLYV